MKCEENVCGIKKLSDKCGSEWWNRHVESVITEKEKALPDVAAEQIRAQLKGINVQGRE